MIIGIVGLLLGAAFKLNHLMGAERLFNAGVLALVIGLLSWGVSLVRKSRAQHLNHGPRWPVLRSAQGFVKDDSED